MVGWSRTQGSPCRVRPMSRCEVCLRNSAAQRQAYGGMRSAVSASTFGNATAMKHCSVQSLVATSAVLAFPESMPTHVPDDVCNRDKPFQCFVGQLNLEGLLKVYGKFYAAEPAKCEINGQVGFRRDLRCSDFGSVSDGNNDLIEDGAVESGLHMGFLRTHDVVNTAHHEVVRNQQ